MKINVENFWKLRINWKEREEKIDEKYLKNQKLNKNFEKERVESAKNQ